MKKKALVKRSGVYYFRVYSGSSEHWVSTGKRNEREARMFADAVQASIERERATRRISSVILQVAKSLAANEITAQEARGAVASIRKNAEKEAIDIVSSFFEKSVMTAMELWEEYLKTDACAKIKESTLSTKRDRFMRFAKFMGDRDVSAMSKADCRRFLDSIRETSDQTKKNFISDISSVFGAVDCVENPWDASLRRGLGNSHAERTPFDSGKLAILFGYIRDNESTLYGGISARRWGEFIELMYRTGLRPVDAVEFSANMYNRETGTIELVPEKTSRTGRRVCYKADRILSKMLDGMKPDGDGLFFPEFKRLYEDGRRSGLCKPAKKLFSDAGLGGTGVTLYSLRHFFVTWHIDNGQNADDVASVVGQESVSTTNRFYYHGKKNVSLKDMPTPGEDEAKP